MSSPRRSVLAFFCIGMTIALLAIDLTLMMFLYKVNWAANLRQVDDISTATTYGEELYDLIDAEKFRSELKAAGLLNSTGEAQVLGILHWVMMLTDKVEDNSARWGLDLLQSARCGGGFLCGDIAQVFKEALHAAGVPERRVILKRDMFGTHDTHVTVEAWINGKWRVPHRLQRQRLSARGHS